MSAFVQKTSYFRIDMSGMLSHNVLSTFFCSVILKRLEYMRPGLNFQEPFTSVENDGVILITIFHSECIKEKDGFRMVLK